MIRRKFTRSVQKGQSLSETADHIQAVVKFNLMDHPMTEQSKVDITIEVEEVLVCRKCGKPHDGQMIWSGRRLGYIHNKCPRDFKECSVCWYLHDVGPNGMCKSCEEDEKKKKSKKVLLCDYCGKPEPKDEMSSSFVTSFIHSECAKRRVADNKIEKMDPFERSDYSLNMISDKINELIDRVNEKKAPPVETWTVCSICKTPLVVGSEEITVKDGYFSHTECLRRKK